MTDRNEMDLLLQNEWRQKVIPNLGAKQWIRVYQSLKSEGGERLSMYSGLIPNENVQAILDSPDWDIHIGESTPSYTEMLDEETNQHILKYDRFGFNEYGIEPLVIVRAFQDLKPETIEISEEFRHFHNLYFESSDSTYVKFDDAGDPYDVVKLFDNHIEVRRKEIRQFLAVRDMSLVVYFDRSYFSHQDIAMIDENNRASDVQESSYTYRFLAAENERHSRWSDKYLSYSYLCGKKIIKGFPPEKSGIWPFHNEDEKEFEKFIIAVDENDEPINFTSNPDNLGTYFSRNKNLPHYLTPVFFRRKVLAKYYNEPNKYRVEDGHIGCGSKWILRIDNNHRDYVIVFLGDLGRDLPHTEQKHWRSYNVPPDGQMSATNFKRSFLAEFADPEDSALRFKDAYSILNRSWRKKFGWDLFKPLSSADSHHFDTLHRPLTTELSELDEIALSISKLLIEGINVDKIQQLIKSSRKNKNRSLPRGIAALKEYLTLHKYDDDSRDYYIEYLEKVQLLRSASASHRTDNKPKSYRQATAFFSSDSRKPIQVADDIFTTLADFLDSIRTHFCLDETD